MNAIKALRPVTCVFQLFGLSVIRCSTFKCIPLRRVVRYYFLLLIAIRFSLFCYIAGNYQIPGSKLSSYVDKFTLFGVHFLEISILIETFFKAHQEEKFMENCLEIDRILMHWFGNEQTEKIHYPTADHLDMHCWIFFWPQFAIVIWHWIFPIWFHLDCIVFHGIAELFSNYLMGRPNSLSSAHCKSIDERVENPWISWNFTWIKRIT